MHQVWEGCSWHLAWWLKLRLGFDVWTLLLNHLIRRLHPLNVGVKLLVLLSIFAHIHGPGRIMWSFKLSVLILICVVEMGWKNKVVLHRVSQLSSDLGSSWSGNLRLVNLSWCEIPTHYWCWFPKVLFWFYLDLLIEPTKLANFVLFFLYVDKFCSSSLWRFRDGTWAVCEPSHSVDIWISAFGVGISWIYPWQRTCNLGDSATIRNLWSLCVWTNFCLTCWSNYIWALKPCKAISWLNAWSLLDRRLSCCCLCELSSHLLFEKTDLIILHSLLILSRVRCVWV